MISSIVRSAVSNRATFSRVEHLKIIVARFLAIVEDSLERRLNMEDTSRDIGVTSRSLRYALKSTLGISPSQFALRRRLDMARDALQRGNCTVKDVARRFGFWELGRFAISYRKLYGEPPSITLKRASGTVSGAVSASRS